mmetsp:Transcript_17501/g.26493  ORF Transcript_17501/g.26493 Transcript_17501/m.26493 type:complete len:549 (+) Transcript_17501:244-1890(+)
MSRLVDRVNRAPAGSRLRSILFEDTSSSEEEQEEEEEEWSENKDGVENAWKSTHPKKTSVEYKGINTKLSPNQKGRASSDIAEVSQSDTTRPKNTWSQPVEKLRNKFSFDNPALQTKDDQWMTSDDKRPAARVSLSPAPEKSRARRSVSSLEALASPPDVDLKPLKKRKVEEFATNQSYSKRTKATEKSTNSRGESLLELVNCSKTREKEILRTSSEKNTNRATLAAKEVKKNDNLELGALATLNTKGNTESTKSRSSLTSEPSESKQNASDQTYSISKTAEEASKQPNDKNLGKGGPKPKKKKKRTFQDHVIAEMLFSCKAYSLKTLASAVNSTENGLNHLMLSLLDKKIVFKKEFTSKSGKIREIYWSNQESNAKEVLKLIPDANEVVACKEELASLQKLEKDIAKDVAFLTQELSNEDIETQLLNLEAAVSKHKTEVAESHERIRRFKSNHSSNEANRVGRFRAIGPPKTPAQLAKERCPRRMKMRINALRANWKSRKEKCTDFIDQLSDGMEKKPRDIIKLLDLETDEMEGVKMPPKYVIDNRK